MEINQFRTYNSKSFWTKNTKERLVFLPFGGFKKQIYGEIKTEFHIKPIHYIGQDLKWHNLDEIASYFGNKNGMILKKGWEEKVNFGWLGWYLKRQKLIKGKGIRIGINSFPFRRLELPLLLNTTTTVFPDPGPTESTSVDGRAYTTGRASWASAHDAADGDGAGDNEGGTGISMVESNSVSSSSFEIIRAFFLFDTSSISDVETINSATLSVWCMNRTNTDNDGQDYANVYTTTPASNTAIGIADFDQIGTVAQATAIDYGNIDITDTVYTNFTLNATGLSNISKTGITKFGMREGHDVENVAIGNTLKNDLGIRTAESTGTTNDPKLVVVSSILAKSARFAANIAMSKVG